MLGSSPGGPKADRAPALGVLELGWEKAVSKQSVSTFCHHGECHEGVNSAQRLSERGYCWLGRTPC